MRPGDDLPDHRDNFTEMLERLAVENAMIPFVPPSHGSPKSENRAAGTNDIEINCRQRGLKRTASERKRHACSQFDAATDHRSRGKREKWRAIELRRPQPLQSYFF